MKARVVTFVVAVAAWLVYFYAVDWLIMTRQGLPVAWNLLPAS